MPKKKSKNQKSLSKSGGSFFIEITIFFQTLLHIKDMEKQILLQIIELSGLSRIEISEKTDVPQQRISEWITGKRNPKLATILSMVEKLGYCIEFKIEKLS